MSITYIEAPKPYRKERTLFIAGGITGCPEWQKDFVKLLDQKQCDLTVFNPRRAHYVDAMLDDKSLMREQIEWEHQYLNEADAISFWFPKEGLCMITLYELGAWSMTNKRLFIGVEPGYKRIDDIYVQTGLVRHDQDIHTSLDALANEVAGWASK